MSRLSALLAVWWPCALVLASFAVSLAALLIHWGCARAG